MRLLCWYTVGKNIGMREITPEAAEAISRQTSAEDNTLALLIEMRMHPKRMKLGQQRQ